MEKLELYQALERAEGRIMSLEKQVILFREIYRCIQSAALCFGKEREAHIENLDKTTDL